MIKIYISIYISISRKVYLKFSQHWPDVVIIIRAICFHSPILLQLYDNYWYSMTNILNLLAFKH